MFDGNLKKHDLNPLIQVSGHYLVDDSDDDSLFINVCRDIGLNGCLCHLSVCKFLVVRFFAVVSIEVIQSMSEDQYFKT